MDGRRDTHARTRATQIKSTEYGMDSRASVVGFEIFASLEIVTYFVLYLCLEKGMYFETLI